MLTSQKYQPGQEPKTQKTSRFLCFQQDIGFLLNQSNLGLFLSKH
jgi:hypothetical protein